MHLQFHKLPTNGGQVSGFGQVDQAEVRLGVVQGDQRVRDVAGHEFAGIDGGRGKLAGLRGV